MGREKCVLPVMAVAGWGDGNACWRQQEGDRMGQWLESGGCRPYEVGKPLSLSDLQFSHLWSGDKKRIQCPHHWTLLSMTWEKLSKALAQCWARDMSSIKARWCWLESLSSEHGENKTPGPIFTHFLFSASLFGQPMEFSVHQFLCVGLFDWLMLQMPLKRGCVTCNYEHRTGREALENQSHKTRQIENICLESWLKKLTGLKLNFGPPSSLLNSCVSWAVNQSTSSKKRSKLLLVLRF